MATARKRNVLVLAVDDSEDDATLLELAFQQLDSFRLLGGVIDGREAIAYLKGDGKYSNRSRHPFPQLLLLDLRMPRVDGFDVLRWLRTQSFPQLQVVVLSGSDYGEDMDKAFSMGAHFFRTKQLRLEQQIAMLQSLEQQMNSHVRPDTAAPRVS